MKKTSVIILSALTVLSVSCAKDNLREKPVAEKSQVNLVPMTFTASSVTKTAVASNGKSVNWVAGDKIAVFDDVVGDALEFKLTGEGGSTSASFSGSVPEGSAEYYAVYPYDSEIACMEGEIDGMTIPADQTSTASNISAGIMVAKADANNKFAFKNVTALLKFNITATDIAKVVITGAGGEKIAGNVNYLFDGTDIIFYETKLTETSITVGDGSAALAAGDYYVVIAPKDELSGLKFTFTSTDGLTAELSGDAFSIAAGDLLNLGTLTPIFNVSVSQFLKKSVSSTDWYQLTGIVQEIKNTEYGNFYLSDNTGTVYVYGLKTAKDGESQKFASLNVKTGDKVTIVGNRGQYAEAKTADQKEQVANAYYVSHISAKVFSASLTDAVVTSDSGKTTITIETDSEVSWNITNDNSSVFSLSATSGKGSASVVVTYGENTSSSDQRKATFVVSTSDFVAVSSYELVLTQAVKGGSAEKYYVKVTDSAKLTSGKYLIVYEAGNLAFDGSLTTLDAASNGVSVTISENKIKSDATVDKSSFTYDASDGTLKSASGYYIGQTEYGNGMKTSATLKYKNTIAIATNSSKNTYAEIKSSGTSNGQPTLQYNKTSGQNRFRYYKTTNQMEVQLYKLED